MSAAISILLAVALAAPPSGPDAADTAAAKAGEHFQSGDYDAASSELERAFKLRADPEFLYARAQAERLAGHCEPAIELYSAYLRYSLSEEQENLSRQHIERCERIVADDAAAAGGSGAVTTSEPVEPPPLADPDADPSVDDPPGSTRPWHRDPAAAVLTGVGLAGVAVGTGLWVGAGVTETNAEDEGDEGAYVDALERGRTFRIAGIVTLSVGASLLVAGIVRYAVLGTRAKKAKATAWRGLQFEYRF